MNRKHKHKLKIIMLSCLSADFAISEQNSTNDTDDIFDLPLSELIQLEVSIATGSKVSLDKAPAIASVITAAEIKAMGARNLSDILETVPGIHVSPSALSRLDPIYSIRGIHTGFNSQVLMMIDGVPIKTPTTGTRPVGFNFPAENISRVEVIRGPGSAIYGADAYSGVINIITKTAEDIEAINIGGRLGSFDSNDFWLQTAYQEQDWQVAFSFAYQHSNGDDSRIIDSDFQSFLDTGAGTSASLAPGPLNTGHEIFDTHIDFKYENFGLKLWNWKATTQTGAGSASALDPQGSDETELYLIDTRYSLAAGSPNWDLTVHSYYYRHDTQANFTLLPPGTLVPIGEDGNLNFRRTEAEIQDLGLADATLFINGVIGNPGGVTEDINLEFIGLYSGVKNHRIRFSVGGLHQKVSTTESKNFGPTVIDGTERAVNGVLTDVTGDPNAIFLPDTSRDLQYISLQDEWDITKNWSLVSGIRYDDYSDSGSTTNPRIALVWLPNETLTTKLLYGSAFRAPSIGERLFVNNPASIGNPDLNPEKIDTIELAINVKASSELQTSINFFKYEAVDLIEFVDDGTGTSIADNARDQDGYGFEWELDWVPTPKFHFKTNFSWQNSEDSDTGEPIADAPEKQLTILSSYKLLDKTALTLKYNFVADRNRVSADPREEIDDYGLLDLGVHFNNIYDLFDIALLVKNATDEDAREPGALFIENDIPLEERSFWASISLSF